MSDPEQIEWLQQQLREQRRKLAVYLRQLARLGRDHAPQEVHTGIEDARAAIARIKADLRALGVEDDQPSDAATADHSAASHPSSGSRQHSQNIGGDAQLGVAVAGDNYGSITINQPTAKDSAARQRGAWRPEDRAAMLANVRKIWIDGVLKQSLWNDALLTLRLAEKLDAVQCPYGLHLKSRDGDAPLPAGRTIQDVYDAQQGLLLILGEPGSGKTTLLLELTRTLIDRAAAEMAYPIPVVFNLASWGAQLPNLDSWMVAQLNREYSVPKKIGQAIVSAGALLPLLDGLDEVTEDRRAACVDAINTYRSEHEAAWNVPLVVCCRAREYDALPKLQLHGAVLVQPLTHAEVDTYLRDSGRTLTGVRAVLKDDPTLYELLETPLMLAVTTLAFAGRSATELRRTSQPDERRRTIFAAFVERQFQPPPEGRDVDPRYGRERTLRWLRRVGWQMECNDEVVFRVDRIQPSWLSSALQRLIHLILALVVSLSGAVVTMVLVSLLVGLFASYVGDLSLGRVSGIAAWLVLGVLGGILAWLSFVIAGASSSNTLLGDISLFEQLRWSWSGALAGVIGWLLVATYVIWRQEPTLILIAGLVLAFVLALGFGFSAGKIAETYTPNQGILLSLRYGLRLGALSAAPIMILGFLGSLVLVEGLIGGLVLSLLALGVGLGVGLAKGLHEVTKHYTLRLILKLTGAFPWNITAFLDSCAQRRLIQRVGGGWRFPHNLIRDYFAELDQESIAEAQKQ